MKTDEFDDIIRQKVHGINTPYTEADIDAVFKHVTSSTGGFSLSRYASHAVVAVVAASVASLVTWSIMSNKQQDASDKAVDQLARQVSLLEKKIASREVDTVYVVSQLPVATAIPAEANNQPAAPANNVMTNDIAAGKTENGQARSFEADGETMASKTTPVSTKDNGSSGVSNHTARENNNPGVAAVPSSSFDDEKIEARAGSRSSSGIESDGYLENQTAVEVDNNSVSTPTNNRTSNESISGSSSSSVANISPGDTSHTPGDSTGTAYVSQIPGTSDETQDIVDTAHSNDDETDEQSEPEQPKRSLKELLPPLDLHFRAGLTSQVSKGMWGLGLAGELFVTRRFSLATGAKFVLIREHRKEKLPMLRGEGMDDSPKAEQDTHTIILQVPLMLSYYFPLKNNFSALASVGADIDLGVWSGRFYGKRDTRRMGDHSETKRTISPVFFNNLVVAAGVEKQWNKCALQLVPFVSLPVRDVDYKSSKPMVGISLGVLLGRSCD